jgi:hypothetical protein
VGRCGNRAGTARKKPQKKGRPEGQPVEVFRRGCLKGTPYVQRSGLLCKCEKNDQDCNFCNSSLAICRKMRILSDHER